jgi:hypothetical protein
MQPRRELVAPAVVVLALTILHDLDHVRQGRSVEGPVVAIGILGDVAAVVMLVLALRGSSLAPPAAVVVGFAVALGFLAVHVLPDWGPLADGYPDLGVDALSWISVAVAMAAGLWLGLAGLRATRSGLAAQA